MTNDSNDSEQATVPADFTWPSPPVQEALDDVLDLNGFGTSQEGEGDE